MDNQTSSGLWKRQSSLLPEEAAGPDTISVENLMENDSGNDSVPLLSPSSSEAGFAQGIFSRESIEIYGHIVASFVFLLAGTSIVPLFAAASNESLRSQNIPFQKTAAGDIILDFSLNYPLKNPATIPSNLLITTCIILPFLCLLTSNIYNCSEGKRMTIGRTQLHGLRASLCGFFTAVGLSEGVTCTLKLFVSRPRPNFYALCQFDISKMQCMAPLHTVREASLSFPSGHSSLSFCAMSFTMYYLLGRVAMITPSSFLNLPGISIKLQPYKYILQPLCCIVPWSYAFFVACSRIVDKWHHPSDVVAGSLLGVMAATIGYHAFYPNATSPKAGIPFSLQQSSNANTINQ